MKRLLIAVVALAGLGASAALVQDLETQDCYNLTSSWFGLYRVAATDCPDVEPPVPDADGDGIPDEFDECPTDPTNTCNEPPPPVDSDGDGIPDDSDPCPSDPTNTCDDPPPPPPPPVDTGEYRGIPEFPAWTRLAGTTKAYSGGGINASGSVTNPAVIDCGGASFTLGGGQADVQGTYLSIRNCSFPNGRLRVQGSHIHFDNVHTSKIGKAGLALSGNHFWIENSSTIGHWASGKDRHGMQATCGSDYIVIVDSESSGNSGDGFQAGHGCGANRVTNVFMGGFTCDANRENCQDFKYVDGVVLSGTVSRGHGKSGEGFESGSDGSGIIFGSDGDTLNAWLIDGDLSDPIGIRVEDGDGAVILDNRFNNTGIAFQKHGDPIYVRGNSGTGPTFLGRPDREQNFCLKLSGNTHPGSVYSNTGQLKCFETNDTTDLAAKFKARFGFDLQ